MPSLVSSPRESTGHGVPVMYVNGRWCDRTGGDDFVETALTHLKRFHDNRRLFEDMSQYARERFEVMGATQDRAPREVFRALSESFRGAVGR